MSKQIMKQISLEEKVAKTSMTLVARQLGLTPDAISKMLKEKREIYLGFIDGQWHYAEFKTWKRGKRDTKTNNEEARA